MRYAGENVNRTALKRPKYFSSGTQLLTDLPKPPSIYHQSASRYRHRLASKYVMFALM